MAITNAASATATMRLTQKPGSVSSLATNSNAALSFSATHLAALLILPQRLSSFFRLLRGLGVDLRLALGDLALVSPGIFCVPPWTLAAWASISLLVC